MSAEKTPGQISWTARNMHLAAPDENPADVLASLEGSWDYMDPGMQEAEEIGAQAVLANRTPWGDVNVVTVEHYRRYAIVRSGGADGEVVKVIGYRLGSGISCYDSVAEWEAANT